MTVEAVVAVVQNCRSPCGCRGLRSYCGYRSRRSRRDNRNSRDHQGLS